MLEAEETKHPVKLTREELYHLVWESPLTHLAKQYGITGTGLAKICHRLNIPYPPPGHWVRKALGKKLVRVPLPDGDETTPPDVVIRPTSPSRAGPTLSPEMQAEIDRLRTEGAAMAVPLRLVKPHPIVAAWLADRERRIQEARLERDSWRRSHFTPAPFDEKERRRHRILDALFKELQHHDGEVLEDNSRQLAVKMLGERIEFQLREKFKQVRRVPTEDEKRRYTVNKNGFMQELQPTGTLVFAIKTYLADGLRREWLETKDAPMEGLLPAIVATFLLAAPLLVEERRKREEEARQYQLAEQRRHEREQRQKLESNRLRRFMEFAEQWQDVRLAREFLTALRTNEIDAKRNIGGKTTLKWVAWVEASLLRADPLEHGAAALFREIAEVDAWTYHD